MHAFLQSVTTLGHLTCLAFACLADGASQVAMLRQLKPTTEEIKKGVKVRVMCTAEAMWFVSNCYNASALPQRAHA
jgi:hypothetical protein